MYLSDILVLLAVLLYTLKQGNCALQKQNDDDTKEKENKDTGNIDLLMTDFIFILTLLSMVTYSIFVYRYKVSNVKIELDNNKINVSFYKKISSQIDKKLRNSSTGKILLTKLFIFTNEILSIVLLIFRYFLFLEGTRAISKHWKRLKKHYSKFRALSLELTIFRQCRRTIKCGFEATSNFVFSVINQLQLVRITQTRSQNLS